MLRLLPMEVDLQPHVLTQQVGNRVHLGVGTPERTAAFAFH